MLRIALRNPRIPVPSIITPYPTCPEFTGWISPPKIQCSQIFHCWLASRIQLHRLLEVLLCPRGICSILLRYLSTSLFRFCGDLRGSQRSRATAHVVQSIRLLGDCVLTPRAPLQTDCSPPSPARAPRRPRRPSTPCNAASCLRHAHLNSMIWETSRSSPSSSVSPEMLLRLECRPISAIGDLVDAPPASSIH